MAFDKELEGKEPLRKLELFFSSGRPQSSLDLPMPPMAYIGMGSFGTSRADHAPMITNQTASYEELKAQVDGVKAALDALLAEAKARFAAANSN